tara:strand:+ start:320 stop:1297 length:978 start_codon:yes stop_codon:yes gene_type:complete
MPKIELPPLPSSGSDLLSTKGRSSIREPYTQSIYVADGLPEPNNGLMSTANGRLTITNLADNFSVKAEHIQPEQASLARSDSMTASSTIYGNGSVDPVIGVQAGSQFFDLPGCAVRWYQPYATSMSLMQWSFFVSYNCWRGAYKNLRQVLKDNVNTPIVIRCKLDGERITGNDRYLAQNMFHPLSPGAIDAVPQVGPGDSFYSKAVRDATPRVSLGVGGLGVISSADESGIPYSDEEPGLFGGNPQYVQTEAHSALHFDLHHMAALSKGFHEITLECSIGTPRDAGVLVMNKGSKQAGPLRGQGYFNLVGKLSLGIRNARVLNLL